MEKMNLNVADILQRIWKAYIIDKSWKPATKGTACQYALVNKKGEYVPNKACFVGFFIPREKKFDELLVAEGSVDEIHDEHYDLLVDALGVKNLTEEDVHFLDQLQMIHDDAAINNLGYDFCGGPGSEKHDTYLSAMRASLESFASFHDVELEPAA